MLNKDVVNFVKEQYGDKATDIKTCGMLKSDSKCDYLTFCYSRHYTVGDGRLLNISGGRANILFIPVDYATIISSTYPLHFGLAEHSVGGIFDISWLKQYNLVSSAGKTKLRDYYPSLPFGFKVAIEFNVHQMCPEKKVLEFDVIEYNAVALDRETGCMGMYY